VEKEERRTRRRKIKRQQMFPLSVELKFSWELDVDGSREM
jgi:hypothetical protein